MALEEFQKEELLQQARMTDLLDQCDLEDVEACRDLAYTAAETAHQHFFRFRFGCFGGGEACIVFVNMGRSNQSTRDRFRRRLVQCGVREVAAAVWPRGNEQDAHYTWAVLIQDDDAARWVTEAQSMWLQENAE